MLVFCVSVFGFASLSLSLSADPQESRPLISSHINMQTVWSTQRHKVKHAWREERESALDTVGELCFSPPCHCVLGVFIMGDCCMVKVLACDMLSFHHGDYWTDLLSHESVKGCCRFLHRLSLSVLRTGDVRDCISTTFLNK